MFLPRNLNILYDTHKLTEVNCYTLIFFIISVWSMDLYFAIISFNLPEKEFF